MNWCVHTKVKFNIDVNEGLTSREAQIHDRAAEKRQKGTKMQLTEPSKTQQLLLHKHQSSPGPRVGKCADPALGSTVTSGAAKTHPLCGANSWSDTTDGGLLLLCIYIYIYIYIYIT